MINASDAWKEMHKETVVPASFIEIRYGIIDSVAQDTAVESDNGATFYSTPERAFQAYKSYKEDVIKQVAEVEYRVGNITKECYEAMMNYEVEIDD